MTVLGNPFPKFRESFEAKLYNKNVWSSGLEEEYGESNLNRDKSIESSQPICMGGNDLEGEESDQVLHDSIQVFIELHEGQKTSTSPFSIHPKQMVQT